MNQLSHWNPFKAMARAETGSGFDQLLREFGMRPFPVIADLPDIRIDVSENDKSYAILADIPGVQKDDIDVAVEGRQVSITARTRGKSEKKDETSLYTERSQGQVYRSFTLPAEVDDRRAEAKYENGVLSLVLPKKDGNHHHRIKVG